MYLFSIIFYYSLIKIKKNQIQYNWIGFFLEHKLDEDLNLAKNSVQSSNMSNIKEYKKLLKVLSTSLRKKREKEKLVNFWSD